MEIFAVTDINTQILLTIFQNRCIMMMYIKVLLNALPKALLAGVKTQPKTAIKITKKGRLRE